MSFKVRLNKITLWILACMIALAPAVHACTWAYAIWGLRSKTSDPLFRFLRNGKAGYIDASGRIMLLPMADGNWDGEFHEGLLKAGDHDQGYRYIDHSGKTVFRLHAWSADDFSEGLAQASPDMSKWGFIDRTGRYAISPQFEQADTFSEGLARISVSGEVGGNGFIDPHGKIVIPANLSYGSSFHEGRAAVILSGPCRITNGGSCARPEFQPTEPRPSYDCRWAFIDKSGQPVSDLRFDDAKDFSEGMAAVRVGKAWGYVNHAGQMSIPPKYEWAEPFSERLAAVSLDGNTIFIDRAANTIFALRSGSSDGFSDGRALVSEKGGYRFIDRTGKTAIEGDFAKATGFMHGLAHVEFGGRLKGTYAWIDTSGRTVFTYHSN
jgi:hypothetical protein